MRYKNTDALPIKEQKADMVEVVRCKDCKHWIRMGHDILLNKDFGSCTCSMWECQHEYPETHEIDFCSCGERSNENAE